MYASCNQQDMSTIVLIISAASGDIDNVFKSYSCIGIVIHLLHVNQWCSVEVVISKIVRVFFKYAIIKISILLQWLTVRVWQGYFKWSSILVEYFVECYQFSIDAYQVTMGQADQRYIILLLQHCNVLLIIVLLLQIITKAYRFW